MSRATDWTLDEATHNRIYVEKVLPRSGFYQTTPQEHPRAIVLAGQPGAGKGGLADAAKMEFAGNVVTLDLDEKREFHSEYKRLREAYPYTWADHTHQDARGWTDKLSHDFAEGRRNTVFDTTLGGADHWIGTMKNLQAQGYEVEVRALATHRLESELGVHERFADSLERKGYGRFVPEGVRSGVYENLPANLDKVHSELPDVRIRIYNREGAQLYDSRATPDLKPSVALEQARNARLTDPERTRELRDDWRAREYKQQHLPESLENNPKVSPPTAQNVLRQNAELGIKAEVTRGVTEATVVDRIIRVEPTAARAALGVKIASGGAVAYDAIHTTREAGRLLDQDNATAAQSQVMHFAGRNMGMVGGAMAVGSAAAAAGVESGPGLFVIGAVGGVIGAVAGDRIMDEVDRIRIYNQNDAQGHRWHYDEKHPDQGWTRSVRTGDIDPHGMPNPTTGEPAYKTQTLRADAALADKLTYQASSTAVELALPHAPAPKNPFSQPAGPGDAPAPGATPWERDPSSHRWSRSVPDLTTMAATGIPTGTIEPASPQRSAQLDQAAQATIASNITHSSQAMAQRYQADYDQYGWKQHGPVPAAVTNAEHTPPSQQRASDGHQYTQGANGQWTTPGALYGANTAQGNVRDELNATRQQVQAPVAASVAPAAPMTPVALPRELRTAPAAPAAPPAGRMSFDEAHRRRDEPEQTSPGSLRPVGKLDVSSAGKGSQLHRMNQAQEQDLMRGLGIALAQDKERLKNEPSPQQHALERTQDRTQKRLLDEMHVQKQTGPQPTAPHAPAVQAPGHDSPVRPAASAPVQAVPPAQQAEAIKPPAVPQPAASVASLRSAAAAEMHPNTHSAAVPVASPAPTPIPMPAQPVVQAAPATRDVHAELAAVQARLAEAEQRARLAEERVQGAPERHDGNDERVAARSTPVRTPPAPAQSPVPPSLGINQPGHPGYELFKQAREHMREIDAKMGRPSDQRTDNMAACMAMEACRNGFKRIDGAEVGTGTDGAKVWMAQGPMGTVQMKVAGVPVEAAGIPVAQTSQQWPQAQQFVQQQQAEKQQGNDQGLKR